MPTDTATVLVVDDEEGLRLLLEVAFSRAGFRVLLADNGAEGERLASAHQPDVIVSDIMMPPPDGFELRQRLAQDPATAAIPFIFLTARNNAAEKIRALEGGASDYLAKPFDREELIARVRAVLRRQGWGQPAATQPGGAHEA